MPICKRANFEGVQSKNKNETFNDNEDVFFCEVTKEIFRDYEDYFRHVMVINSTVWQCESTGRENLTYAEALKSEKRARKKMELFKESLRAPAMLVIESAKQSSIKTLASLIAQFLRKRYFLNEIVTVSSRASTTEFKVVEILLPDGKKPDNDTAYEDTEKLSYKLQRVNGNNKDKDATIVVPFANVRRHRSAFTKESLNIFIKHNIIREQGILRAKADSYKKYVKDHNITFKSLFIGKLPHFTPAKIRPMKPAAVPDETAGATAKKQSSMNKYLVKKSDEAANKDNAKSKISAEQKEKERVEKAELKAKTLKEQMERVRQEKLEKLAALEREKTEKRAKLMKQIADECDALLTKTDDLERSDQRLLPVFTPVKTFIGPDLIGDAFMIREFMHTYRTLLSGIEVFRPNLNFYEMSRAFTKHEVVGPLSDILLILMGTIFDLQREEESECTVTYQRVWGNQGRLEPYNSMTLATLTHFYAKRFYSFKINELPLDAHTLSEVLRLHLLSSGSAVADRAEKWRVMYRNGYSSIEDPGLHFCSKNAHILRALSVHPVYHLSFGDVISIIQCLMSQIATYSAAVNMIEERMEQQAKVRNELKNLLLLENRRVANVQLQRRTLTNAHNQQCLDLKENIEDQKRALEDKLNKKVADLLALSERDHRKYEQQIEKLNTQLFDYLVFLGMDRAYRKYYVMESMPGIFIEHLADSLDVCLSEPPKNILPSSIKFDATTLPRNRKDLRIFLLRKYKDEEKATAQQPQKPTAVSIDNKENQENHSVNGLPNGGIQNGNIKMEADGVADGDEQQHQQPNDKLDMKASKPPPTQTELYMCSGDPENCIVHSKEHKAKQTWSYIYEKDDIEMLIESLNPLGERESHLREQLTTLRELILVHVRKCPTYLLTIDDETPKDLPIFETDKKYQRANYGLRDENDMNVVMRFALIERVLQLELDIYSGDLGRLKVKDMEKWRKDVLYGSYDPQCNLQWGFSSVELVNGDSKDEETAEGNDTEQHEEDSEETTAMVNGFKPGEHLKRLANVKDEYLSDDPAALELRSTHATWIRNLSSALLQVEQAIERRFIKEPFGLPLKDVKDKESQKARQAAANERIKRWEVSLMQSTSYSQVFLHLNILHDNIVWSRSTNKSNCMICRRGSDPDKMLLCDECNGGTHMFCMKPKMKTVPKGNWYCQRCVNRLGLSNNDDKSDEKKRKATKRKFIVDDVDDNNSESSAKVTTTERSSRRSGRKSLQVNEIEDALNANDNNSNDDDDDNDDNDDDENNEASGDEENDDDEAQAEDDDGEEHDSENEVESESMQNGTAANTDTEDNNETVEEDDDEPVCKICSYDGSELVCSKCKGGFHLECVKLRNPPRYLYVCQTCRAKDQSKNKRKIEDSSDNDDDEDDDDDAGDDEDEDTEDQEMTQYIVKRSRSTRSSQRGSNQHSSNDAKKSRTEAAVVKASSSSGRRSLRRTGDDLPLNSSAIYKLLEEIMKSTHAWPFIRPVSLSEVPDYNKIIKTPMDLAKVKSKLNMGEYRINEEVMNDINLVFKNCDKYNESGNEIYEAGKRLEKSVIKLCKELHLPYKISDLNK